MKATEELLRDYAKGNVALQKIVNDYEKKIRDASIAIVDMLDSNYYDKEGIKAIASALDIPLTKTVSLTCNVKYVGTAEIDFDIDPEDIDWTEIISFNWDASVGFDVDLTEDDMDIDAREKTDY